MESDLKKISSVLLAFATIVGTVLTIRYTDAYIYVWQIVLALVVICGAVWIINRERHFRQYKDAVAVEKDFRGIVQVWENRGSLPKGEAISHIEGSNRLDLVGLTMRNSFLKPGSDFDRLIRSILDRDNKFEVRIVLPDPQLKDLLIRRVELEDGKKGDRLVKAVYESLEYLGTLKYEFFSDHLSGDGCRLKVYLAPADMITGNLIITDHHIFVTPYLIGIRGTSSPTFLVTPETSPIAETYRKQFKNLIEKSSEYCPPRK